MSDRLIKLNALLRDEVAHAIKEEIELEPGIIVTITRTFISPTLENANIMISVYPESKTRDALELINKKIYAIQQILNSRLQMRPVPKIRFEMDQSEEEAEKIDKLLQKIKNQE